jgi:hypothetical protein
MPQRQRVPFWEMAAHQTDGLIEENDSGHMVESPAESQNTVKSVISGDVTSLSLSKNSSRPPGGCRHVERKHGEETQHNI